MSKSSPSCLSRKYLLKPFWWAVNVAGSYSSPKVSFPVSLFSRKKCFKSSAVLSFMVEVRIFDLLVVDGVSAERQTR